MDQGEFVVYVLLSEHTGKTYTGFTSDLINRMRSHNQLAIKGFTLRYRPWKVIYVEFHAEKPAAMKREQFFKSGVGREFVRNELLKIAI